MSAAEDYLKLIDNSTPIADKLVIVEQQATDRLNVLLGTDTVPAKFNYIIAKVVGSYYVRIGAEGTTSTNQDGLSQSFLEDDFAPFMDEINSYKNGDDFYKPQHGKWWLI